MYLNNVWQNSVAVIGISGLPKCDKAESVIQPFTSVRVAMRLSPVTKAEDAMKIIKEKLTTDVPYNCKTTLTELYAADGWA